MKMADTIQNIASTGILIYDCNITAPLVLNVQETEEELVGAAQKRLSQEQCDAINQRRRERMQQIANTFVNDVMDVTEVRPNDSPEVMRDKAGVFDRITGWISGFKDAVLKAISQCLQWIKLKVTNAATIVKNFFKNIYRWITD